MRKTITPIFIVLCVAFTLWASATALSRHAEIGFDARSRARMRGGNGSEGGTGGSAAEVIAALKEYEKTLQADPKNKEALLGIARISLGVGVADKAREYFERYLAIDPNELRVKSEYALALGQLGETARAISILEEANKAEPRFYIYLALGVTYETAANFEKAIEAGQSALTIAANDDEKEVAQTLLTRVTQLKVAAEDPAAGLEAFFRNHPILGPKIVGLTWESDTQLRVRLQNFPIEQMPPFAKQSLIGKVQVLLAALPKHPKVFLSDADSNKSLLEISSK